MSWLVTPANPDTSSYAVARVNGGPLDPYNGVFGCASVYERREVPDPAPADARRIADDMLRALSGGAHTMTVKCVPQPWLEPGDVILIDYTGTTAAAQVVGWQMDAGDFTEMTVTVRGWRVVTDADLPTVGPGWPLGAETIGAAVPVGAEPPHMTIPNQGRV